MDFKQLTYFVALAEELHFGRAATRLGIVQPALTQSIRRLEATLETPLLLRLRHHLSLTSRGEVLLKQAREMLRLRERAEAMARGGGHVEAGRVLRIGTVASAQFWLIPDAVTGVCNAFPDVRVVVREGTSGAQFSWLLEGEVDLMLGYVEPGVSCEPSIATQTLWHAVMYVAVPADSELACRPHLRLADLADESFIWHTRESDPRLYDAFDLACRAAGFVPRIAYQTASLPNELSLVAGGVGIALMNQTAGLVPVSGVALVPLLDMPRTTARDFVAAWRRHSTSSVLNAFVSECVDAAQAWQPTATIPAPAPAQHAVAC